MKTVIAELAAAPGPDELATAAVAQRAANVIRPNGAFERLDRVAAWLAGWQRTDLPEVVRPGLLLAAADHGVAKRSVAEHPREVTAATVDAIRAGVATSAILCSSLGASLRLLDVGVGEPTADLMTEDAMDTERFLGAFAEGRDAVATMDVDLLLLGGLGVGSATAAAAVALGLFGGTGEEWVGPVTDEDGERLGAMIDVVESAVRRIGSASPFDVLRRVGGLEFAALAGAAVEARVRSIPTLLDGFDAAAALAPLEVASPGALDNVLVAHVTAGSGHGRLLEHLGKEPLLDLGLRMGEGSGALIALPIVQAAARAVIDVATYDEWGLR